MNAFQKMAHMQGWGPAEFGAAETAWNAALEAARRDLNEEFKLDMDTRADITRVINDLHSTKE